MIVSFFHSPALVPSHAWLQDKEKKTIELKKQSA